MRYPVAKPDLAGNEVAYVTDALESSWISSRGAYLDRLEEECRLLLGAEQVMACVNGTAALHLALLGLDIGPGDEVIVPSFTYVASANAVAYTGATPVFADCKPDTWCLDPQSIQRLITPRTRAIMPVHLYGQPCNMEAIEQIAKEHELAIVEDAAEALGARYRDRPAGVLGDVAAFSFFGNKIITTGEGGLVVCRDPRVMRKIRLLAHQGMDTSRRYWHDRIGFNYRMTNLAAAVGVAQLERIHAFLSHRALLANWYDRHLQAHDLITLPTRFSDSTHAYWMYGILVQESAWRDPLMQRLAARGIETRPFFHPVHEFPMYRRLPHDRGCPVSVDVGRRGICLPTYFGLGEDDVRRITDEVGSCLDEVRHVAPEASVPEASGPGVSGRASMSRGR